MSCRIALLVAGLALFFAVPVSAQDAILGQKYGHGVHAYFAGDYTKAYEYLTSAIEGGSKDPRVFYFRGLSYLKLGRPQEAAQDFKKGADLESTDVNKFYNASKSLERVQGEGRATLETYRVEARMATMEHDERLRKARYEAIRREEERVRREAPVAPAAEPVQAAEPGADEAADPFVAPAADAAPAVEEKPAPKAKKAEPKPEEEPAAEENPFGGEQAKAAEKPAEKKASGKKSGVLGAMGKALGKAVGGDEAKKAEPAKKPKAAEKPAEAEENPFGEAPAAEEKKKPAAEKPASDDPFAQ